MQGHIFDELRNAIENTEAAKRRESAAREAVLGFMHTHTENTVKVGWATISKVTKLSWSFRDSGVTAARKKVEKLEADLKAAKAILKGAEDAAKAAGGTKAKVENTDYSLMIRKSS
jgi:hypothetical protein